MFYLKVWQLDEHQEVDRSAFLPQMSKKNLRLTRENHDVSKCGGKIAIFNKQTVNLTVYDVSSYPDLKALHSIPFDKASNAKRKKKDHVPVMVRFSECGEKVYCAFRNGRITMTPVTSDKKLLVQKKDANFIADGATFVNSACMDAEEKYLVVNFRDANDANSLTVIDARTFKVEFLSALEGFGFEGRQTEACAFSDRGALNVFLGSDNGDVHLFSLSIGKEACSVARHDKLTGRPCPVSRLAVSLDGNFLLSGSTGNSRTLWRREVGFSYFGYLLISASEPFCSGGTLFQNSTFPRNS